jgi:hypothetical protein
MRKVTLWIATTSLVFVLAGCGGETAQRGEEPPPAEETTLTSEELDDEETAGELTEQEPVRANDETTGVEDAAGDDVEVGGFTVGGFAAPDVEVPRATATQEDVLTYFNQVEPVIGESARDVSEVVRPQARVRDGRVELGVDVAPVEEASQAAQQNLERLRQVQPPEELEPIHNQLVDSYEKALPAYDNIIEAFDSGDPQKLQEAVQENLPLIEQFNAVERGILQDLQEATPERVEGRG